MTITKISKKYGIIDIIIDNEDIYLLENKTVVLSKSENKLYVRIRYNKKYKYLHRIIINCPQNKYVDHINGNSLDNRKENLRICTNQQNSFNSKKVKNTSSKYKGVHYAPKSNKINPWQSYIKFNNKRIHIGYFKTEKSAAKAYNKKASELFKEYAKLNEV